MSRTDMLLACGIIAQFAEHQNMMRRTLTSAHELVDARFDDTECAQWEFASHKDRRGTATMNEVSLFRLYVLRATYLLFALGLGSGIWPGIVHHPLTAHGVAPSLLAGLSALWVLGIRYPLKMLPLLLFELVWKLIWLIAFGLPLWSAHQMDADTWASVKTFLGSVVVVSIAMPWPYVFANYVKDSGDRWARLTAEERAAK